MDATLPAVCPEQHNVFLWRYEQARLSGFDKLEARLFADSDGDLAQLRHLLELGCSVELAARIVV